MGGLLIIFGGLIVLAGCARAERDGLYFMGAGMAVAFVGLTLLNRGQT